MGAFFGSERAESRLDYFDDITTESTALQNPCSLINIQGEDTPNLPFFDKRQSKISKEQTYSKRQNNNFFPTQESSMFDKNLGSSERVLSQQQQ